MLFNPVFYTEGSGGGGGSEKIYGDGPFISAYQFASFPTWGMSRGISGSYADESVTAIEAYAFMSNTSLTRVSFPKCTAIDDDAFYGCRALSEAYVPECKYIGSSAFYNCVGLTSLTFDKCEYIGMYAFAGCSFLTAISLPECRRIESNCFYRCSNLSSIYIPNVYHLGAAALSDTVLETVDLPECEIVGQQAFPSTIKTVSLPKCTIVATYGFYGLPSISEISLPACEVVLSLAFARASSLEAVYFGKYVTPPNGISSMFYSTKITTRGIFVPSSLYSRYVRSGSPWRSLSTVIHSY